MSSKKCYRCKVVKPFVDFGSNRSRKDGLNAWCKPCVNESNIRRSWFGREEEFERLKRSRVEAKSLLADGKKTCWGCGEVKDLDCFKADGVRKDGRYPVCLSCSAQKAEDYRWRGRKEELEKRRLLRDEVERLLSNGMKRCSACSSVKMIYEFADDSRHRDGKQSNCRTCNNRKIGESKRKKYDPTTIRYMERSRKYGITVSEYKALIERGVCDCCGSTDPGSVRGWVVDHDHACHPKNSGCRSCIRGVLCQLCNVAFGMVKEDVGRLKSLIDYANSLSSGMFPARDFLATFIEGDT